MGYSDSGPSPRTARRIANELAELLARSRVAGPVVLVGESLRVSTFECSRPITRSTPQVSYSWTPRTKTMHMRCLGWRDSFSCCRRPASSDCLASRSANPLNRWHQLPIRARDDVPRIGIPGGRRRNHSHSEDRVGSQELAPQAHHSGPGRCRRTRSRRQLATVATRSSVALRTRMSDHAQQSGHVVAIDQPEIIVDAIRTVVETARGHDVPLCETPAPSGKYHPPRR